MGFSIAGASAQSYQDDIYYNPKKTRKENQKKKPSAYIEDFSSMDVDEYNLRGAYYPTPLDTIGAGVENGEDFVYTQQIQKFYNPRIVVDNAAALSDILDNSYGNVEIYYNLQGVPTFVPIYSPYWYSGWGTDSWYWNTAPLWSWGPSWSWGWGPSWSWGPSLSWGWGPSWSWAPSWSWGWGPSWGNYPGHWHAGNYRPYGHRTSPLRPGWAADTRRPSTSHSAPGGNYGGGGGGNRYTGGGSARPGAPASSTPGSGMRGNRGRYGSTTTPIDQSKTQNSGRTPSRYNGSQSPAGNTHRYNTSGGSNATQNGTNRYNHTQTNSNSSTRYNTTKSTTQTNSGATRYNSGGSRTGGTSSGGTRGSRGGGGGRGRR